MPHLQCYNIWGPDGLVSSGEASSTERYYPITDHHGSVRLLTDSSGNVVNSYTYTPYGEVTASSSSPTIPYLYTSEQFDGETGLIYLRARYYDPETGRFISRDPVRGTLDNPLSQNPYQYALDNPVMYSDSSGEVVPAIIIGAWILAEIGLSAYDGYSTYKTLNDPCASDAEKALASTLFAAGIYGPGGGYNAALKVLRETVTDFTPGQLARFEKMLGENGIKSLQKSKKSLEKLIIEHFEKIDDAKRYGGYTSSMEKELKNFQQQINAITEILNRF